MLRKLFDAAAHIEDDRVLMALLAAAAFLGGAGGVALAFFAVSSWAC